MLRAARKSGAQRMRRRCAFTIWREEAHSADELRACAAGMR